MSLSMIKYCIFVLATTFGQRVPG